MSSASLPAIQRDEWKAVEMPELRRIAEAVEALVARGERAVLATIVDAEGSAYRREGARLLISESGSTVVGAVSGGCLDADLFERSKRVLTSGEPELVTYDSNDQFDLVFGTGLGCGGRLTVMVEPVTARLAEELKLARPARRGELVASMRWQGTERGTRLMVAAEAPDRGLPMPDKASVVHQEGLLVQRIDPPLRLVVFGAGPAAATLCNLASDLDWIVEVADHREIARTSGAFPRADALVIAPVEEQVARTSPDENTAVVVMTHNVLRDQTLVRQLASLDVLYIGVLGPKKRSTKLLKELRDEGVATSAAFEERLYGPTGLSIGAESPSEIALSILAEIQAARTGATPTHLRDREGPIHKRHGRAPVVAAVLAAGASTRLGTAKQLVEIGDETLLKHACVAVAGSGAEHSCVILGAGFKAAAPEVEGLPVDVIVNDEWPEGLSSSVRAALRVARSRQADGLLLSLCDQPGVDASLSGRLIDRFRGSTADIVACRYEEGGGVPAVFAATVFDALEALTGDRGAKELIRSGKWKVDLLPIDPGPDVDTPEDADRVRASCNIRPE